MVKTLTLICPGGGGFAFYGCVRGCTTYSGPTTDDSYQDHGAQQQPNNIATYIKRSHQVYGGAFWLESQDALVFWG